MDSKMAHETARYLEENLDKALTLDEVAAHMGYSKYHLNREFARVMGTTIYKYIQQQRLERAAVRLACEGAPVVEIALDAGYGSQQSFTHAFTLQYGCSPSAWRQQARFRVVGHEQPLVWLHAGAGLVNRGRAA